MKLSGLESGIFYLEKSFLEIYEKIKNHTTLETASPPTRKRGFLGSAWELPERNGEENMKMNFFNERQKFGYRKWHEPIGRTFVHCESYSGRIYTTLRLLSTPFGCVRIETAPAVF
jgi:hypothetical protein